MSNSTMPDEGTGQQEEQKETVEALPTSEKPEEVNEEQTQEAEPTLPDGVKERTAEEFEKLKARNKELAHKLAAHETPQEPQRQPFYDQSYADPAAFGNLNQQQVTNIAQNYVDENGYVDVNSLNNALNQANLQAKMAIDESRRTRQEVERFNHTREMSEAYKEYPELDPESESFDQTFLDIAESQIYKQLTRGQKQNLLEAAKTTFNKLYNPRTRKTEQAQDKEQAKAQSETKRTQATTQVGGNKGTAQAINQEELVAQSRKGGETGDAAIAKRLQASGF